MRREPPHALTDAIYDAALDPAAWSDVMALLKRRFDTGIEGLYFLDFTGNALHPVHISGVSAFYYGTFPDRYFTPDNPWTRSAPLHRLGVVRTDTRLGAYFRDPAILMKSQYYNDWLRPQALAHSMGTTLFAEAGVMANFTLLRARAAGSYTEDEVAAFTEICGHLKRALTIARRLETATAKSSATTEALDCLPYGVAFVDLAGRLVHANRAAEALLAKRDGLTVRAGRLVAADLRDRARLDALLAACAHDGPASARHAVILRREHGEQPLTVSALRLSGQRASFLAPAPHILLLIADPTTVRPDPGDLLRQRYDLTPAEARLALTLRAGHGVRRAAEEAGMTYETARWYLKIIFQKTGTRRQAELVARLLQDATVPLSDPAHVPPGDAINRAR
jgi:DNA-binding CsgD family transcriptional regulator